jgi:hypothetical protein
MDNMQPFMIESHKFEMLLVMESGIADTAIKES